MFADADFPLEAAKIAHQWHALLHAEGAANTPLALDLPANWVEAVAALVEVALLAGDTIQVVVPDDHDLPELSAALDLELRPLCLLLPGTAFAIPIALRATLSLLRGRLGRGDEQVPAHAAIWAAQRDRLLDLQECWEAGLAWSRSNARDPWPDDIGALFPAHLMSAAQALSLAEHLAAAPDITVLVAPERLSGDQQQAMRSRARVLALSFPGKAGKASVPVVIDENIRLRNEMELLAQEVADLELELATVQGEMEGFTRRYFELVGTLMVELDALQSKLSLLRAEQLPQDAAAQEAAQAQQARAERSQEEQRRFAEADTGYERPSVEEPVFRPSVDLRKLFRKIAQKIHPDRAHSEADRSWRTQLMSEANRAYRNGDEAALHEVMALWNEGPRLADAAASTSAGASSALTQSLTRQVEQMRQRLGVIQTELDQLLGSRLYELFVAARLARRQQRDLLQEMADLLSLQIAAAKQQIEDLGADKEGSIISADPEQLL